MHWSFLFHLFYNFLEIFSFLISYTIMYLKNSVPMEHNINEVDNVITQENIETKPEVKTSESILFEEGLRQMENQLKEKNKYIHELETKLKDLNDLHAACGDLEVENADLHNENQLLKQLLAIYL